MSKTNESFHVLRQHFFRRFFDNDTLSIEGDTLTTVIRVIAFVAVPSLMFTFWLQPQYPHFRPEWARIADRYFCVLDAFVTMGLVAVFEWEMLFADKMDFLVLSPLPVRQSTMLRAKAAALGQMLGLFLFSTTVFGALILPGLDGSSFYQGIVMPGWIVRFFAHVVTTVAAGSFAALSVIALGGLMLCLLPARWFRTISVLAQMTMVAVFTVAICLYPLISYWMRSIVDRPEWIRWLPPVWFLGCYERLLGNRAAWAVAESARAWQALLAAAVIAVAVYPLAWARRRRMTIENTTGPSKLRRWLPLLVSYAGAYRSEERAVFGFVLQTLTRHPRYQTYLALYAGAGFGLVTACVTTIHLSAGSLQLGLSQPGLHAVMPMLLFWLMMGLRMAFAFPVDLQAAWVFPTSGVDMELCVAAARWWVLACGVAAVAVIAAVLGVMGMSWWGLLAQAVCGVSLVLILADLFFTFRRGVPFTRARLPGKTSLPLMMAMYLGIFPTMAVMLADHTLRIEKSHRGWIWPVLIALVVDRACRWWREREGYQDEEYEMEGTMTLGLSDI